MIGRMNAPTIIATRESRLALWQAEHVKAELQQRFGLAVELLGMTTRGDQILDRALSKVGGKGLFVKELETALERGEAHLAVHSLKDVPMELPEGFALAAIWEREDPRDAFVSNRYASVDELPQGAVVGTSSLRRVVQLLAHRPDLRIVAIAQDHFGQPAFHLLHQHAVDACFRMPGADVAEDASTGILQRRCVRDPEHDATGVGLVEHVARQRIRSIVRAAE